MRQCLALDIGGTKLAAALVDETGQLSRVVQAPTQGHTGAERLFSALVELAGTVLSQPGDGAGGDRVVACGVGCGGPMSPGGETVSPLNIAAWRRFPLRSRLTEALGLPVLVENDAKALALGEGWLGAARGRGDFIAMVVSTGVGGGIVSGGQLLHGRLGNAGHVGHMIVVPGGRRCACGARGCLEAEASGTAIAAMTGRPAAEAPPEMVARTGTLVGRAVAAVANTCDLDLAVVAGSVALGFGAPFFSAAQAELSACARLTFSDAALVVQAGLGANGGLVGAGALAWRAVTDRSR